MDTIVQPAALPQHETKPLAAAAALSALGIVYGDIGTSPLYAFKQAAQASGALSPATVLGVASLIFWTLILISGRLAIPHEMYEAASVDGANEWHKFRYVTWPSMQTLYITCTLLSMIWTLGDFNSVYLLTGGGPADLTHVLATLGIRYLRLDQVDLSMATIVCAMPLVLPLVYFMMKRLSR